MIRSYDDITTIDRYAIETEDQAHDTIRPRDLLHEALTYLAQGHTDAEYLTAGAYNAEGVSVLYLPDWQRGGIAWGADATWTDADSADDALERFFGVDGKEMIP